MVNISDQNEMLSRAKIVPPCDILLEYAYLLKAALSIEILKIVLFGYQGKPFSSQLIVT